MSISYEILGGFPTDIDDMKCFGRQPSYSEGYVVRFKAADGRHWVGNFAKGQTSDPGVFELGGGLAAVIAMARDI